MKLRGKVAIVTGSSRGIGKQIAIGFGREGADVIVTARTETEGGGLPGTIYKTADEIRSIGGRALAIRCNVTSEQDVNELVQKALVEFGHIDVIVNNAAVAVQGTILEMPLKRWELVIRVNLLGPFLCIKAVLPHMVERRTGSIINISSTAATIRHATPSGIPYGVTKAAIERLTWGLAAEVGQFNIAVNCLKPRGAVDTEGMRLQRPNTEWSKWDSPEMMVRAAIFFAGQDAQGVTGAVATDEEIIAWHGLK